MICLFLILLPFAYGAFPVKQLAGPPSNFGLHQVPNPRDLRTFEKSASIFLWWTPKLKYHDHGNVLNVVQIPVDGPSSFVFSLGSPYWDQLTLELMDPHQKIVPLNGIKSSMPIGDNIEIPTMVYIIPDSIKGNYKLTIRSTMPTATIEKLSHAPYPNAVLTVINNDFIEIESHYTTYKIKVGEKLGIVSTIVDAETKMTPESIVVSSALMEVITPDGQDLEIPMSDNEEVLQNFGIAPHSNVYAAQFVASKPGEYIVQAMLGGIVTSPTTDEEVPFIRSTQHIIQVSGATLELTGSARLRNPSNPRVLVDIGVTGLSNQIRAYAEVYGLDSQKQETPVCWIGGIVETVNGFVTLELDTKWLGLAKATGPLVLKNVYIADLDTTFPISISSNPIPVKESENLVLKLTEEVIEISQEMLEGVNPLKGKFEEMKLNNTATASLVLLPGYCSPDNPWSADPGSFTNALFFDSKGGNLANHEFASRALNFIESHQLTSFSVIGHSQGGMISAHIRNYFFTGLDNSKNGRRIQTVGTPWNGCSAAGSLANLGDVFGVGCGSNNDLSLDGAKVWLTGITPETRKDVYFYTTTYEKGKFFGDSCSLAMNLVLEWPNDGTTELVYASLPGANYMGNTEKWCHTTSMNYPPQYSDSRRNKEMNAAAAR